MKILMVSIFAPHFINWAEQLKNSGHEVYWMDVFDSNVYVEKIGFAEQIIGWRYKLDYPGRYFLKENYPKVTNIINKWNERIFEKEFEKQLEKIKPDVVHSFVMFQGAYPIFRIIEDFPEIKWVYSSWGSDMYFLLDSRVHLEEGQQVLPRLDYMFSDCHRDHKIAINNGFKGKFLGVFPGRGGFDFVLSDPLMQEQKKRNIILIKGYQGQLGRCIEVLKAIEKYKLFTQNEIVVFGAGQDVFNYVKKEPIGKWGNLTVKPSLAHIEILKLMGQSLIYIGNSISDGMPNTLLEAIIMGVFPVQSNPGGASGEIIKNGFNGFLIEEPNNIEGIGNVLKKIDCEEFNSNDGLKYNLDVLKPKLEREFIRKSVLKRYLYIENNLKEI